MLQDIHVLQYIDPNSTLAIIFATLTVWAVAQRLKNKKNSALFLSMLIASSLSLCAITFDNDAINNLVYSLQQEKQINFVTNDVAVAFSPKQGATKLIINTIEKCRRINFRCCLFFHIQTNC
jgi:ABC-type polysaccharide transport system permease subunit